MQICRALLQVQQKALLQKVLKPNRERAHRRWHTRPVLLDHEIHGAWFALIPVLRKTDHEGFYNFFRMTVEAFDRLLALVSPCLQKHSWRKPICPGEMLAITLRFVLFPFCLAYYFSLMMQCFMIPLHPHS